MDEVNKPQVEVNWDAKASLGPGKKQTVAWWSFIVAVALVVVGLYWWFMGRDTVVAQVGEVALTESTCSRMVEHAYLQQSQGQALPEEQESALRAECRRRVVAEFIRREVLNQTIQQMGITVDDAFRTTYIQGIEAATKRSVEEIFAQSPLGEMEARAQFEQQMLAEKLIQEAVASKIQIADEEIQEELAATQRELKAAREAMEGYAKQIAEGASFEELVEQHSRVKSPGSVSTEILKQNAQTPLAQALLTLPVGGVSGVCEDAMMLLIVKVLARTPAQVVDTSAQKKQAEDLRLLLTDGEDFAKLAKEYSACPSKEAGGSLGTLRRGQTVAAFDAAAFSQPVGEIGPVVQTEFGYHIIKVTARDEAAGTVEAAHILIAAQANVPEKVDYAMIAQLKPRELSAEQMRAMLMYRRTLTGFENFLNEQKRVLGVTCPEYPELVAPQP